jgi:hypothetical protein
MGKSGLTAVSVIFLIISLASFTIQLLALAKLYYWPSSSDIHKGLLRTSICRFAAAVLYVGLAVTTLASVASERDLTVMTLAGYCLVQLMWQANAVADVRLRSRLARSGGDKPRNGRHLSPVEPADESDPA